MQVKPNAVLIELCSDRVGLLMDPNGPSGAQMWASRTVSISGLPDHPAWPTADALQGCSLALKAQDVKIHLAHNRSSICRHCRPAGVAARRSGHVA